MYSSKSGLWRSSSAKSGLWRSRTESWTHQSFSYTKNWVDLKKLTFSSDSAKRLHVDNILRRKEKRDSIPPFLDLIYNIRFNCIVLSYFPTGSKYDVYLENYENHDGWDDFMTDRERKILNMFKKALEDIKKDHKNVSSFNKADEDFGKYRYDRWASSMK